MAIPPGLAATLHDGPPVEPRPSASVLVVRASSPLEVLLMRRPQGAEFAPGAWVFPGGTVHAEDHRLGDDIRAAAVRELFEEVGLLLARPRSGGRLPRDPECGRLRALLEEGASFPDALAELDLVPAFDRLVTLTRWITPVVLRRRYDTRFYLARLPPGQTVHPQEGEVVATAWARPAEAVRDDGPYEMVFATRRVLGAVAGETDAATLFRRVRRWREQPPVTPRVVKGTDGGFELAVDELPRRFVPERPTRRVNARGRATPRS